jgi:hypothetical protein
MVATVRDGSISLRHDGVCVVEHDDASVDTQEI